MLFSELRAFLLNVTGSVVARSKSIEVQFADASFGAVAAHTCANTISFPEGIEPYYEEFKCIVNVILGDSKGLEYNTV